MVEIQKDNITYIFCDDKNSDFYNILSKYDILKKDGTAYKNAEIEKDHSFYINGINYNCHSVKHKKMHLLIFNDEMFFSVNTIGELGERIKEFSPIVDKIVIGEYIFEGTLERVEDGLIKDSFGRFLGISKPKENSADISSFILRMKKDNAQIISPLIKRFAKTSFLIRDKRSIMGYAHLPTYFRILKGGDTTFSHNIDMDPRIDYLIDINSNTIGGRIKINNNGEIIVDINNSVIYQKNLQNSKKVADPYLLISSQPINIHGSKLPYIVSTYEKRPIFISVLLFSDTTILKNMKGGIDLLKIN